MPRAARMKDPEALYHIMAHSISEFDMFPENRDKDKFLDLLSECKEKFHCKVYGFCLMTNHYHFLLDTNGFDVSKFMQSLNLRYALYIKKAYGRKGHLLAERFTSKIVSGTEGVLTVSAYIHNNPKDMPEHAHRVFDYPYSSMGIYLGKRKDLRGLIDTDFILGCVDEKDKVKALKSYAEMVDERRETGIDLKLKKYLDEFIKEQYEYKPYRTILLRNMKPEEIVNRIAERFDVKAASEIMHRWKRRTMRFREAVAYALTVFCGMGTKETCAYMKNITGSSLARLSSKGFELFRKDTALSELFQV